MIRYLCSIGTGILHLLDEQNLYWEVGLLKAIVLSVIVWSRGSSRCQKSEGMVIMLAHSIRLCL